MRSMFASRRAIGFPLAIALACCAACSRVCCAGRRGRRAPTAAASQPGPASGAAASQPGPKAASAGPVELVSSCTLPSAPDSSTFRVAKDVTYSTAGGKELALDIAWPTTGGPHPVVVFIHGGGWSDGAKYWYASEIETLASLGYAAATIDYRLAQEQSNIFPAAVQDVRCALRWLVASKDRYAIDDTRVAVAGGSAGG
jgi:acetyl esterase/lipase